MDTNNIEVGVQEKIGHMFYFTSKQITLIRVELIPKTWQKNAHICIFCWFFFKDNLLFNLSWIKQGRQETYYIQLAKNSRQFISEVYGSGSFTVWCSAFWGLSAFYLLRRNLPNLHQLMQMYQLQYILSSVFAIVWEVLIHAIFPVIWVSANCAGQTCW